ncbi:uncharacterized protein DNG_09862 [Cephalotrichum gorgonifer]|uniref:Uncharacterized protein n=1 Tax=Cephalotrichum gorgonifer TaxID=2041049 RepID=A0AAE8SZT5_9PEZI|nr:uncharacterized protein DNG_09862 [Cephalotrichum gorgonifer]
MPASELPNVGPELELDECLSEAVNAPQFDPNASDTSLTEELPRGHPEATAEARFSSSPNLGVTSGRGLEATTDLAAHPGTMFDGPDPGIFQTEPPGLHGNLDLSHHGLDHILDSPEQNSPGSPKQDLSDSLAQCPEQGLPDSPEQPPSYSPEQGHSDSSEQPPSYSPEQEHPNSLEQGHHNSPEQDLTDALAQDLTDALAQDLTDSPAQDLTDSPAQGPEQGHSNSPEQDADDKPQGSTPLLLLPRRKGAPIMRALCF